MTYKNLIARRKHNALRRREMNSRSRIECLKILGNKCNGCGINDIRVLCIDHVNGGGKKEIKLYGGSYFCTVLKQLLVTKKVIKYQLLCFNCNHIKRIINNESAPRKYV